MKKLLLVLVSFVLVFGLASCNKEEDLGVIMNWNIGADPATLDPSLNGASDGGDVINQTFEGLVREIDGVVYPGVAESWVTSADGKTVTFTLRDSNWSDGTPVVADDFVYAWLRGMDPNTASEYAWIWEYTNVKGSNEAVYDAAYDGCVVDGTLDSAVLEDDCDADDEDTEYVKHYNSQALLNAVGISAPNDSTFVVELNQPTSYFVSLMAFYHFMPTKESAVEQGEDGTWAKDPDVTVSNGPFVLTKYETGAGLRLQKNEEYWNKDVVGIDTIEAVFIDEATTAFTAFNAGDLDFIPSVPTAEVANLILTSDEFHVFPLLGTYYYSFNMDPYVGSTGAGDDDNDDGLFANKKLRTALSYSIDREIITETLGAGQVPAGGFVPPGFLDDDGLDFFEVAGTYGLVTDDGNYTAAITLFAEAAVELGYTVAELQAELETQTLLYNTSEGHALIAQMVQEMWEDNLGFTINLANEDWAIFQQTRKDGNFDIARGGWLTDFMDPSGLLSIFTSLNAYNDPNYYNPAFDTLMSDANSALDIGVHFDKLYEAQTIFMGDMPIIPVYHYTDTMLVKDYVVGWGRSVLGSVDFSRASIEE
jgi:oligopeptide transport system substrate-binding protein